MRCKKSSMVFAWPAASVQPGQSPMPELRTASVGRLLPPASTVPLPWLLPLPPRGCYVSQQIGVAGGCLFRQQSGFGSPGMGGGEMGGGREKEKSLHDSTGRPSSSTNGRDGRAGWRHADSCCNHGQRPKVRRKARCGDLPQREETSRALSPFCPLARPPPEALQSRLWYVGTRRELHLEPENSTSNVVYCVVRCTILPCNYSDGYWKRPTARCSPDAQILPCSLRSKSYFF